MLIREEERQQKQVQSLIKGWMLKLESLPAWPDLDEEVVQTVRLAVIRAAWGAYKIGLFSQKGEFVVEKES